MGLKKFLTKLAFNRKQREIIWKALIFSEYTYRRRNNVDDAAVVQTVINETLPQFGLVKTTYSKDEVDEIVKHMVELKRDEISKHIDEATKKAYEAGVKEGQATLLKQGYVKPEEKEEGDDAPQLQGIIVGTTFDPEKCKSCEQRNDCVVGKAIAEAEDEQGTCTEQNGAPESGEEQEESNDNSTAADDVENEGAADKE